MKYTIRTNAIVSLFFISTLLLLFVSFYANFRLKKADNIVYDAIKNQLISSAMAAALYVTPEELESYKHEKAPYSEEYLNLRKRLEKFGTEHHVKYVYYFYENGKGDGKVNWIVDNDTDPETQVAPDNEDASAYMEGAVISALNGVPDVTDLGQHDSAWGELLSAFAPIYDKDGNVAFVAGVDIADDHILELHHTSIVLTLFQGTDVIISVLCGGTAIFFYSKKSKQALAASMAKGQFLSQMSHEMRTPMNAIIGMSTLAMQHIKAESEVKPYIDNIVTASNHLLGIINDILDMSKIEATKLTLANDSFLISDAINEINVILSGRFSEKGVSFIIDAKDAERILIIGDKMRLKQVIVNLLGNAVKFTPKDGTVTLSVKVKDETEQDITVYFSVKDTGIGLDEEQKSRIFKAFEQADSSTAANFGGTGLGLSISQNIVSEMNASIQVASEPGKGSEFYFTVTFDKGIAEEIIASGQELELPELKGKRIVITDDVDINRMIVIELIEATGAEIEEAINGPDIVEKFSNSPIGYFDLILMDIQMPGFDGYEATKRIRELDRADAKKVVIIAMTANAFSEDINASKAAGMDSHISKPIYVNELYTQLREKLI